MGKEAARKKAAQLDRCYWWRSEDGGEVLIPGCMGCAVNGPEQCTCDVPESRIEQAERQRDAAREAVLRLREKAERRLEQQQTDWWKIKRLRERIRELEGRDG